MNKPIHQKSFAYNSLRELIILSMRIFHRKITVVGQENIPDNMPTVFVLNHQNALIDALALSVLRNQQVFMARSDVFKNSTAAKFLRKIKILPIYRIRDGIKSLKNNDAVFEEAIGVLEGKKTLGILPEGNHFGHKRLRVLKKGIARIVFKAEERNDFKLNVQIIPVGLDYSKYSNFGGRLLVNIGKPFTISSYKEEYLVNEQKGMNSFMQELRTKLLPQMLNINDSDNYDGIKALVDFYSLKKGKNTYKKNGHLSIVKFQQSLSDKIISLKETNLDDFTSIVEKGNKINEAVKKLKFRQWVLKKEKYSPLSIFTSRFLQILFFPIYLYGFIANIIPFQLPTYLSRNVKDPQFLASFRMVLGLVTFIVSYLITFILLLIFIKCKLLALAVFISIPLTGLLSFKYYVWFKKTSAKFRNNRLRRKQNSDWLAMRKNWNEVIDFLETNLKA